MNVVIVIRGLYMNTTDCLLNFEHTPTNGLSIFDNHHAKPYVNYVYSSF